MFVGTTEYDDQKKDNLVLNGTFGHPRVVNHIKDLDILSFQTISFSEHISICNKTSHTLGFLR